MEAKHSESVNLYKKEPLLKPFELKHLHVFVFSGLFETCRIKSLKCVTQVKALKNRGFNFPTCVKAARSYKFIIKYKQIQLGMNAFVP